MVTIKLLIVDDHPMVREGLSVMLATCDEITLLGSCSNSEDAIKAAMEKEPDIILMDIKMEGKSGIETTKEILILKPQIKVIFLTVFEDTESIRQALQSGAAGYILKHVSREKLIETIKRVFNGETVIDQSIFHQIVNDYTRLSKKVAETSGSLKQEKIEDLTPREQEILQHLVKGLTNKEISTATNLAVDTVKTHLRNIFRKFGVKNRTQAITQAMKLSRNPDSVLFYDLRTMGRE
ncbi:MAG: response regulator transcription factor [Dethiobacteria bacterium]|jgi:two-component system vancomycin resistance associated response regulator VraR